MSKTQNYITWGLTLILALAFLGAGFSKVTSQESMVEAFTAFGLPAWFRITIGVLEILGAVLLVVPSSTGASSFGLSILMIGAFACHAMYTPLTQGIPALFFFVILTYIYLARKNVVPLFLQKHLIGEKH
jgi:putative oxidoreductase